MRRVQAGVLLLLGVMVASCGGAAPPPAALKSAAPVTAAAQAKKGPTPEQLTVGMVEAAVLDKGTVPINLKFELADKPKVGRQLEINLALISKIPLVSAEVQVTNADGFEVPAAAAHFEVSDTAVNDVFRHSLRVVPIVDGVLFVALTVSSRHDEVVEAKGFSIPVIVER